MKDPTVSVVMTVYNAEDYLREAIEGILEQSYKDFEFIIIDDGSTDKSLKIIKSYQDDRIIVRSRENKGVVASSNEGISMARAKYIARQDADDISHKDRLDKQVRFLDNNQAIDMVGTNYRAIDETGKTVFITDMFTRPDDLKLAITFTNQFGHGSTMMRKTAFDRVGHHSKKYYLVHDYDLWMRLAHCGQMANLKETLYIWRYRQNSHSNKKFTEMQNQVQAIREREFKLFLHDKRTYHFLKIHPFSTAGGVRKYFNNKGLIFRDMALMYCYNGLRRRALSAILLAFVLSPWAAKNYRYLFVIVFSKGRIRSLVYE